MLYRIHDVTSEQDYSNLLDIAFKYSDAFSVCTYKHNKKKYLSQEYYDFFNALEPYRIIEEYHIPKNHTKGQKYHVYELNAATKKLIRSVKTLQAWKRPLLPDDLAFYLHKKYWLYIISHEDFIFMIPPHQDVIKLFLDSHFRLIDQVRK